ncbi:hypothetical protein SCLCIDRAFT_1026589 [Scleroderma citrinum Foug A]|uniref:Uncharacterized protein n=1 Tax=Scleroderma citrinum Foug A TaxID=1036808 RepID=A0A0C3DEZ4_9AGAM|nr:hypothetical protein SCLCIDRAFT_1026589 [Scleroderma citrinum Foug A]
MIHLSSVSRFPQARALSEHDCTSSLPWIQQTRDSPPTAQGHLTSGIDENLGVS